MSYQHLFTPLEVGPMTVRNRVMLPPHGHVVSSLWGSEDEARRHIQYWQGRTDAGWVDGVSAHVRNNLAPGFEPTGVGAVVGGHVREGWFVDRVGRLTQALHAEDTRLTVQLIMQGGMPNAPSPVLSGPVINQVPHPLHRDEIDWFVEEYRFGAARIAETGADGAELHLNHDDLMEWFVSPLTNRREDEYGGSLENRLRFPLRVLAALRDELGPDRVLGVRLNLREEEPGGYGIDGAVEIARALESSGLLDYLSCAIGSPWGNPSYIQPHQHQPAEWSHLAGRVREAVKLPVVYSGRVNSPRVAEEVLASGHADLVGMARAHIADGRLLSKAQQGREDEIRPCVGGNECISRRLLEPVTFSCAVNPSAGREDDGVLSPSDSPGSVLVVGGGPAGMEAAALAAERGHRVTLVEATDTLGGQLRDAALAPTHEDYATYLLWQERRLARLGVTVRTGTRMSADDVAALVAAQDADRVVVATGGRPRWPGINGQDLPHVHQSVDVLRGGVELDEEVLVVAQDDHLPPLAVADHLAGLGHRVTLVHGTTAPAPLLSRYIIGSALGRLDEGGVVLRGHEQVMGIEPGVVTVRNIYSHRTHALRADSVVLSCGAEPVTDLIDQLRARGLAHQVIGDAFAPRRLVWATRQAYELVAGW